jgi:hypothetical protein
MYCGMPAGMEAFRTADKVINDMTESGELPVITKEGKEEEVASSGRHVYGASTGHFL